VAATVEDTVYARITCDWHASAVTLQGMCSAQKSKQHLFEGISEQGTTLRHVPSVRLDSDTGLCPDHPPTSTEELFQTPLCPFIRFVPVGSKANSVRSMQSIDNVRLERHRESGVSVFEGVPARSFGGI
jgi:hypothetical protein